MKVCAQRKEGDSGKRRKEEKVFVNFNGKITLTSSPPREGLYYYFCFIIIYGSQGYFASFFFFFIYLVH